MTMTIPTLPNIAAGNVVQPSDLNAIGTAVNFILNKPIAEVRDATGGVTLATGGTAVTYTTVRFDSDGMWNATNPDRLTIQTNGWYRLEYIVSTTSTLGDACNAAAFSTTGANNPAGAGHTSAAYWASYTDAQPGNLSGRGVWPFYLYQGDYIQIKGFCATGDTLKTSGTGFDGGAKGGSILSLEYVGCTP